MPVDAGVEAPGFIEPANVGQTAPGISVSKYQPDVDFVAAKDCGARFALVRLTAGTSASNEQTYKEHWRNAKSVGLWVTPFHNLSLQPDGARKLQVLSEPALGARIREMEAFAAKDATQSALFLNALKALLASDPVEKSERLTGKLFLEPMIDVTYDPLVSAPPALRRAYAPVVRTAACAFVGAVKSDRSLNIKQMLIFTTPTMWRDYDLGNAPCDLSEGGIVLSLMTRDGGTVINREDVADICKKNGRQRCVMEHYTSYTSFLNFGTKHAAELLRFYGNEASLEERLNAIR